MGDYKSSKDAIAELITRRLCDIKQEEGDYLKDGLLYCGKCHTPKQTRCELFGKEVKPRCLCKCEEEKRDAEEERIKQEQKMLKIARLRKIGFPDAEMRGWTFQRDDKENEYISKIARNYVEHFSEMQDKGKGLLFYGPVGTGKTFMSASIANALIDKGYPCLVTNFARLTNTIMSLKDKQPYIDSINRFDLLVIDDLASERDTEFMNEIVASVIDARYMSGKPLIVTTNLTAEELKNTQETRKQRVYSRLLEMCIPVEVKGADRRKEKLKQDYAELKKILEL